MTDSSSSDSTRPSYQRPNTFKLDISTLTELPTKSSKVYRKKYDGSTVVYEDKSNYEHQPLVEDGVGFSKANNSDMSRASTLHSATNNTSGTPKESFCYDSHSVLQSKDNEMASQSQKLDSQEVATSVDSEVNTSDQAIFSTQQYDSILPALVFSEDASFNAKKEGGSGSGKDTSIMVEETIWGDFIYKDITGYRAVLEFLNVYAGRYAHLQSITENTQYNSINPLKYHKIDLDDPNETKVFRMLNPALRIMLFNNVLDQPFFAEPKGQNIWEKWWQAFCDKNDLVVSDQELNLLKTLYCESEYDVITGFKTFREHISFLRAMTFDIDSNQRFSSLYLFPFGIESIYYDAEINSTHAYKLSADTRFFKGTGHILFGMLLRVLNDSKKHFGKEDLLKNINEKLKRKFIEVNPNHHFAPVHDLVRLLSISPEILKTESWKDLDVLSKVDKDYSEKRETVLQLVNDYIGLSTPDFLDTYYDKAFKAKEASIKFLPCNYDELFEQMAQDVDYILGLDTSLFETFDLLNSVMNIYLLRYIIKRSNAVLVEANKIEHVIDKIKELESQGQYSLHQALALALNDLKLKEKSFSMFANHYSYFVIESDLHAKNNEKATQVRLCSQYMYSKIQGPMIQDTAEIYVDYRVKYALLQLIDEKGKSDEPLNLTWNELTQNNFEQYLEEIQDNLLKTMSLVRSGDEQSFKKDIDNKHPQDLNALIKIMQDRTTGRKKDDYNVFYKLAKSIGLLSREGAKSFRFILSDKLLKSLVVVILKKEKYMRDQVFFDELFKRFGIIVNAAAFNQFLANTKASKDFKCDDTNLDANAKSLLRRLIKLNLCEKLPDSSIYYIKNPHY